MSFDDMLEVSGAWTSEQDGQDGQVEQLWCGVRLSDVQEESISWLSKGRLAHGKLTVLDGDPGIGKTSIAVDIGARVTSGQSLPDGIEDPKPQGVVMMTAEDGIADTILPRARVAGADLSRFIVMSERPDGALLNIPTDIATIEDAIRSISAGLLIIDPLVAHLSPNVNANSDQDVRRALAHLRGIAERTQAAILAIRHLKKAPSANALHQGGGSIGIIGAARFGLLAAVDPRKEGQFLLASSKSNLAKSPNTLVYHLESVANAEVARVVWSGTSQLRANDILASSISEEARSGMQGKAERFLKDMLANGPLPGAQVEAAAIEAGNAKSTVRRAREVVCTTRKDGAGAWLWELREKGEPLAPELVQDEQLVQVALGGVPDDDRQSSIPVSCGAPAACGQLGACPTYMNEGRCWSASINARGGEYLLEAG